MTTFKLRNNKGNIVEVPNQYRQQIQGFIDNGEHDKIDEFISKLPKKQAGGQQSSQLQDIVNMVAQALQQGADPNAILQELVQKGLPQDKAQQIVEYVIGQMQQQMQQQQGQQGSENDIPEQPEMMEGGMMYDDMFKLPKENQYIAYVKEGGAYTLKDDELYTVRNKRTLDNTLSNPFFKTMNGINQVGDPDNMLWALSNKGLQGKIKGVLGTAGLLSGAALGYGKLASKDKSTSFLNNPTTSEYGKPEEVYAARKEKERAERFKKLTDPEYAKLFQRGIVPEYIEQPIETFNEYLPNQNDFKIKYPIYNKGGQLPKAQNGSAFGNLAAPNSNYYSYPNMVNPGDMSTMSKSIDEIVNPANIASYINADGNLPDFNTWAKTLGDMGFNNVQVAQWYEGMKRKGVDPANLASWINYYKNKAPNTDKLISKDIRGVKAANNSLVAGSMATDAFNDMNEQKEFERRQREAGFSINKFVHTKPKNLRGDYTLNAGLGPNFQLDKYTPIQSSKCGGKISYQVGGEYEVSEEELEQIKKLGGEFEIIK